MLIYVDTMILEYIIKFQEFVFGRISGYSGECPVTEPKLRQELNALRELVFIEQFGNDWIYACTTHLWDELNAGKVTAEQQQLYSLFKKSWKESEWMDAFPLNESAVLRAEDSLKPLLLQSADQRHLAEAIVLNAAWFLTNDTEIIKKCNGKEIPVRVARPSECLSGISVGLFLK